MNQRDLSEVWSQPAVRRTDPETSAMAAADASMKASHGRLLVLINLNGRAMTDFELADATGWSQTSIGKRRGECVEHGLVEVALDGRGETVKRPAPSGSMARVWQITAAGRAFIDNHNRRAA